MPTTPAAVETHSSLLWDGSTGVLVIEPGEGENPEQVFQKACCDFENKRIEQDEEGKVYVMPPAGGESSNQNIELSMQLALWAKRDGRGRAFDSSVAFIFPNSAKYSPDSSWVSKDRLRTLTRKERRKFLTVVPEFVIELKSPTDRYPKLQEKMEIYLRNGVELGWLIHPDEREVRIYTQGGVRILNAPEVLHGEGSVAGFQLDLQPVWEGLDFD
jgi:Uma2 family endonuclease